MSQLRYIKDKISFLRGNLLFGELPRLTKEDPLTSLNFLQRNYGDNIRIKLGSMNLFLLNHPHFINHILYKNPQNYPRPMNLDNLFEGEKFKNDFSTSWTKESHFALPHLTRNKIDSYSKSFTNSINLMLERWNNLSKNKDNLNVVTEMTKLSIEIVGKTLLGIDLSERSLKLAEIAKNAINYLNNRALSPINLPLWIPTQNNQRFKTIINSLDEVVTFIIKSMENSQSDFLYLLNRNKTKKNSVHQREIRTKLLSFLTPAYETTSSSLSFIWYLLSKYPKVRLKLKIELDEIIGKDIPTYKNLSNLSYCQMIIKEALRLFPPQNSIIAISQYIMHRSSKYWNNANEFIPERFSSENRKLIKPYTYFPFGGSQGYCVGQQFAVHEMLMVIAMVSRKYTLDIIPNYKIKPITAAHTLFPFGNLPMRISKSN